ncbi:MAG: FecR domain-containing protein [Bacteroidota bacterium]
MSKHYRFFAVQDFALDDYFIQWVKSPSADADAFWSNWIKDNPNKKEIIEEARQVVLALDFSSSKPSQKEFSEVKAKIDEEINLLESNERNLKISPWKLSSVAAAIILFVVSLVVFNIDPQDIITHTTAYGETKVITLPDQSTVTLNANSTLRYTTDWENTDTREVWLEGEGFFDIEKVVHAELLDSIVYKRFLVYSGALNVEVLGTTFNINNRKEAPKVVLSTGKIALEIPDSEDTTKLLMKPGDFVKYVSATRQLVKKEVDPIKFTSWKENKLYFEDTSLSEVAEIIEDNYGMQVVFEKNELKNIKLTGTMSTTSLQTFIDVLSESIDKNIVASKGQLIIKN